MSTTTQPPLTARAIDIAECEAIMTCCASILATRLEQIGTGLEAMDLRNKFGAAVHADVHEVSALLALVVSIDLELLVPVSDQNAELLRLLVADEQSMVDTVAVDLDKALAEQDPIRIDGAAVDVRATERRRDLIAGVLARVEEVVA